MRKKAPLSSSQRSLHKERQDLLGQWDDAVDAMRKRDTAIENANERFQNRKAMLSQRQEELDAQAQFLENEVANNKELEGRIEILDRDVVREMTSCSLSHYILTVLMEVT